VTKLCRAENGFPFSCLLQGAAEVLWAAVLTELERRNGVEKGEDDVERNG
jgi:hypothetical protein